MNKKLLLLLTLLSVSFFNAHAESYNFSDATLTVVEDYSWGGSPATVSKNTIDISGTTGTISDLNVTISGINSGGLIDMTFVLIAPDSTAIVLSSNAGGGGGTSKSQLNNVAITFDDQATKSISQASSYNKALKTGTKSGSYQTSVYTHPDWHYWNGSYALLDPVESGIFTGANFSEDNLLSAFEDISANGTWQLLAYDNLVEDSLSFTSWSLDFSTESIASGAVPEPAEWMLIAVSLSGIIGLKRYRKISTITN